MISNLFQYRFDFQPLDHRKVLEHWIKLRYDTMLKALSQVELKSFHEIELQSMFEHVSLSILQISIVINYFFVDNNFKKGKDNIQ